MADFPESNGLGSRKASAYTKSSLVQLLLRDMEHMMSAFVYADQESRVNRAVSEYSVDPRRAEATLRKSDRRRETFYSINTGGNWYDKENYTLCLNSGALGIPLCADIIVSAAQKTIFV